MQTGTLEYAIVEVYGKTDGTAGMTLEEFTDLILEKCPDAITAYNFDGGGSTNLMLNGKKIHKTRQEYLSAGQGRRRPHQRKSK